MGVYKYLKTLQEAYHTLKHYKFYDWNYQYPINNTIGGMALIIGYPNRDSIYLYAIFHRENPKQYFLNISPSKVSRYFHTLLISNCKFKITAVTQIDL